MPLYEFDCLECGAEFERLVKRAGETAGLQCPSCGGSRLEEKISGFASISKDRSSRPTACAPTGG